MLRREKERLHEDEKRKQNIRNGRLESRKKIEIMTKERKNYESVMSSKNNEQRIQDFRYTNNIKFNIEKSEFSKTMDGWAGAGFS